MLEQDGGGRGCPQPPGVTNRAPAPGGVLHTPWRRSSLKGCSAAGLNPGAAQRGSSGGSARRGLRAPGAAQRGSGRGSARRGLRAPGAAQRGSGRGSRGGSCTDLGARLQRRRPRSSGNQGTQPRIQHSAPPPPDKQRPGGHRAARMLLLPGGPELCRSVPPAPGASRPL